MSADVQTLKLSRLIPDPENVNQHNEVNIAQIKASIQRFGFLDPIGVVKMPEKRGYFMIVEGHGRYEAATELEMDDVPCIVLDMNEAKRKGYAIAHNQTQQIAALDTKAIAMEFERLDVVADDYISLGYSQEDVMFLPGMAGGSTAGGGGGGHFHQHGDAGGGDAGGTPEGGAAKGEEWSHSHFNPTVHRTALTFASDQSYNRFVHVLGALRGRYPDAVTIGERLIRLLGDMGVDVPSEASTS